MATVPPVLRRRAGSSHNQALPTLTLSPKPKPNTNPLSLEVMNMMMMSQYFDMLQQVGEGQGNQTIFIPHLPGAVSGAQADIASAMRQGVMEGGVPTMGQSRPGGITFNGSTVTRP